MKDTEQGQSRNMGALVTLSSAHGALTQVKPEKDNAPPVTYSDAPDGPVGPMVIGGLLYVMNFPMGILTLGVAPAGAVLVGSVMIALAAIGGVYTSAGRTVARKELEDQRGARRLRLVKGFRRAQRAAYHKNCHLLATLADEELRKGRLLDEGMLDYLVRLDPAYLGKASDQLAITVLQARRALAWLQCDERRADGSCRVGPVPIFAAFDLNADNPHHRYELRRKLEEGDVRLKEDDYPREDGLPEPDLSAFDAQTERAKQKVKNSFLNVCFSAVAAPVTIVRDTIALRRAREIANQNVDLPAVAVPSLLPVDNVLGKIVQYNTQFKNQAAARLDLPAINGWPQIPRRLVR